MKKLVLLVVGILIYGSVYAATILIPDNVTEPEAKEWMSILQERKSNAKIQVIPEIVAAVEVAKIEIDTYRKAIGLAPKFEVAMIEEAIEIKEQ